MLKQGSDVLPADYEDAKKLVNAYRHTPESEWLRSGYERAEALFFSMSRDVPAYRKFLHEQDFAVPPHVTPEYLQTVPAVDKDNYLRKYARSELCWDGKFKEGAWVISTTSGSTGKPFYFPRTSVQDAVYGITAEAYLLENFDIATKSTLYIVAFPMGAWIGGLFTYEAIKQVAEKGYNLSIITPGINKQEIINAVKNLGSDFDQIIIGSYAPFLKDILDDGERDGIDWHALPVKFIFSAEAFSEEFRDFLQKKTGLKDVLTDTLNHYGTVDMGTMAHETPVSILVRRLAIENQELYRLLFGEVSKLPTLAQYDPNLFYFEETEGNLFCSSFSGFPLFRYDLKDHGGVRTFARIRELCEQAGIDLQQEIEKAGIAEKVWNLPFVFVFERSDFSVSFFAFQIYPETLRKALLDPLVHDRVTGKFMMQVTYDDEGSQLFRVHIELAKGVDEHDGLRSELAELIIARLLKENSEYRKTAEEYGVDRVAPIIELWPYEDPKHFRPGGKQRWIHKEQS